ncbi:MAG: hypothetical protein ACQES0_05730 [Bacteroidota bacterium]
MRTLRIYSLLMLLVFPAGILLHAQEVNPRSTSPLSKWDRRFPEIKVGDRIYQTGSNWMTAGLGPGYSTTLEEQQINMAIAYHFRYKPIYFKVGYHFTDDQFFMKERRRNMGYQNDIVGAAGIRYEKRYINLAFFIGPSFAFGMLERPENPNVGDGYYALGVMPEVQITYKMFYDVGVGASLYGSFNKNHQCVGLRFHIYFSGAYRGVY